MSLAGFVAAGANLSSSLGLQAGRGSKHGRKHPVERLREGTRLALECQGCPAGVLKAGTWDPVMLSFRSKFSRRAEGGGSRTSLAASPVCPQGQVRGVTVA